MLDALAEQDGWLHGYELSRRTGVKPGTLYPLLERLADRGWLEARWEDSPAAGRPRRHAYRLTQAGIEEPARTTPSRTRANAPAFTTAPRTV